MKDQSQSEAESRPTSDQLVRMRESYERFILDCREGALDFRLTPRAEPSPFARCFGIFGLYLIDSVHLAEIRTKKTASAIRRDLDAYRAERKLLGRPLVFDKPYQQLLSFSLSALAAIGMLDEVTLQDHVEPFLKADIVADLNKCGALKGKPSSGNLAMFMAILRLYAIHWLKMDHQRDIDSWVEAHRKSMNGVGFWEANDRVCYSQFQNGYHQYEIFEWLGVEGDFLESAAHTVAKLADRDGHFGPYPGGGGCYDYDAAALLLAARRALGSGEYDGALGKLSAAIFAEQNDDGGFCETRLFLPHSPSRLFKLPFYVFAPPASAVRERMHLLASLSRPRFARISTHWSAYSRRWDESNLWDSWFRTLAVGRIESALQPDLRLPWRSIDFPGIGFFKAS